MVKQGTLFTVIAIVLLFFGLMWFFVPAFGLNLYGIDVEVTDTASLITRYWGSAFLGVAVMTFLARKGQSDSIAVRAIIYGGLVLVTTGLVAALIDAITGNANNLIWSSVAFYAIFVIWFGYFAFKKQPRSGL